MSTVVVINGERDWGQYFPDMEVVRVRIQDAGWVMRDGQLWVLTADGAWKVDGVLWRVGAIANHWRQRAALNLIRQSGVPCVTRAAALVRCHDRLAMLAELREAGLPVVEFDASVGPQLASRIGRDAPFVAKVGSHHGGHGKVLVRQGQWPEIADLVEAADDYVTTEPFIDYVRDVRVLLIGDRLWGMARKGSGWRANVDTVHAHMIDPPEVLAGHALRFAAHIGAEMLALDALEDPEGRFVILESNETPGLAGFPETTRWETAALLASQMIS